MPEIKADSKENITLHIKPLGSLQTNCVIIANKENKKLIIFDAPQGVDKFAEEFPGYTIEALLFTHGHFDHILGTDNISKKCKNILGHKGDKNLFEHPEIMSLWMDPEEVNLLRPVNITKWLKDGEELEIADLKIEARPCPGHTPGGIIYYVPALNTAIVGDTLFKGSIGRTDLPGSSTKDLLEGIKAQVFELKEDTFIIPGHGPTTTVGEEKASNPYISL